MIAILAALACYLVCSCILGSIVFFIGAKALSIVPERLVVGIGPRLFSMHVSGINVVVQLLPVSSYLGFDTPDGPDEAAIEKPNFPRRLLLATLIPGINLLIALALLGSEAIGTFARGFTKLPQAIWPFGSNGPALIEAFSQVLENKFPTAIGVLFAIGAAFAVITSATAPFLWLPKGAKAGCLSMGFIALPVIAGIGIIVNIIRAFL